VVCGRSLCQVLRETWDEHLGASLGVVLRLWTTLPKMDFRLVLADILPLMQVRHRARGGDEEMEKEEGDEEDVLYGHDVKDEGVLLVRAALSSD
jgi:hypothetical protein